jgi:hypothetical protein
MDSPESTPRRRPTRAGEKERAMAIAQERRQAILVRARRIRRSVAALTATLFSVAFLVIYVQLASGHDPALVANAKRAATEKADIASSSGKSGSDSGTSTTSTGTTSSSTPTTSTESDETSSSGNESASGEESSSSGSSSGASEEPSSSASAVTTSQS